VVLIGNPVFLKNKEFWIPAYTGMTANVIGERLLQKPHLLILLTKNVHTDTIFRFPYETEKTLIIKQMQWILGGEIADNITISKTWKKKGYKQDQEQGAYGMSSEERGLYKGLYHYT
jgi:hypothetical protein